MDTESNLGNNLTESGEKSFAAYLQYGDGRKVLYASDTETAHRKILENPDIREKVVFEGNNTHEFLKKQFDYALGAKDINEEERADILRFVMVSSLDSLCESLEMCHEEEVVKEKFSNTSFFLRSLVDNYKDSIFKLFREGLDYTTTNHSLNMMALSINIQNKGIGLVSVADLEKYDFLGQEDLDMAKEFLLELEGLDAFEVGKATLFHDLGKSKQIDLFSYNGVFSEIQREEMKKHPSDGVEVLKSLGVTEKLILGFCHNHHRRVNGTGYPEIDNENYPVSNFDYFGGIIDSFEAMTSKLRGYQKIYTVKEVLEKLKEEIISGGDNPIFSKHMYLILVSSLNREKASQ